MALVAHPEIVRYGDDPSQFAELYRPMAEAPRRPGVVVVIHGGFWKSAYDLAYGRPLARDLADRGWTAYNLEYRRVGPADVGVGDAGGGGGNPETFDDVAAGIDSLDSVAELDLSRVVTLGHSAGAHLAVWAAGRGRVGWPEEVSVTAAISQAGVLDLRTAYDDGLGSDAVGRLLGHPYGAADAEFDPARQLPLGVPVTCLHARDDEDVPFSQSTAYVDACRSAGGQADLVEVTGGHFGLVTVGSPAWEQTVTALEHLT